MYPRFESSGWDDSALSGGGSDHAAFYKLAVDGEFFAGLPRDASFFIVRHGQSEGNATRTFQGRHDYPLDAVGMGQARAAGAWLAGVKPDAIVASPMKRAAATASIIAEACGLGAPEYLHSLVEVDVGPFSGETMESAARKFPEAFGEFRYHSWDAVPGAEHSRDMYARAVASWMRMRELAAAGAKSIVCVSHGGLIQWLIRATFGVKTWLPLLPTANCGISRFDVEVTDPGLPAFVQWPIINFKAPSVGEGAAQVF